MEEITKDGILLLFVDRSDWQHKLVYEIIVLTNQKSWDFLVKICSFTIHGVL